MFRNFAEFVALHYALSIRDDTPYWIANVERVYDPSMVKLEPTTAVGFKDLQHKKMVTADPGQHREGIPWISVGMNYPVFDRVDQILHEFYDQVDHRKFWAPYFSLLESRKEKWKRAAEKEMTLYQYLKTNIYKDEE
jgi:hypothetical protein